MGEAVLSAVIQVIFERLSSQVLEEYNRLLRDAIEGQIRKLRSLLSTIQLVLKDTVDQQVVAVAYDADDLLDEYVTEAPQQKMEFHHLMEMRGCIMNTVRHFYS
ncbi:hypothetical protein TorRG33x02_193470 [Trema orientale]|uniref:Disease resistance N-terminal domain-containing protein n=1 Tax=Trema orientale TaxID=63057 RepID=A0A2P5EGW3_TREOI|nr:hypothetical protein TorRG33x02_193470 [Trema orientale]